MSDLATEIQREDTANGERYVLTIDGHLAQLTFSDLADDKRLMDHTLVPKALGGRGIGKILVKRAVEDARAEGKSIIPQCWYVKQQIDRTPEWQDLLA